MRDALIIIMTMALLAAGYFAAYVLLHLALVHFLKKELNRPGKIRLSLLALYFANLIIIYQIEPEIIKPANQVSGLTYLWAWATVSCFIFLTPDLARLFRVKAAPETKAVSKNLASLAAAGFLLLGLALGLALLLVSDFHIIYSKIAG